MIRCIECGNKEVVNIGDLCPDCHLQRGKIRQEKMDELKKYGQAPFQPDNDYDHIKWNHVKLIGISEQLMRKIIAHERGMQECRKITESMQELACEIIAELQEAVKE